MRIALFLAVMLATMAVAADDATVSASTLNQNPIENSSIIDNMLAVIEPTETDEKKEPKIITHTVADNETLSDIAKLHKTTWQRLYDKNTNLEYPDIITVGEKLIIPLPDEKLARREVPEPPAPEPEPAPATVPAAPAPNPAPAYTAPQASYSGNLYDYGYCTWYVKNRRPDLPNNLGNADTWVSRAQAQGIPTGPVPRPGAVGQRGMHVVYVERVNSDGTVFISEMNREGWNVVSTRTVPAGYFYYIY